MASPAITCNGSAIQLDTQVTRFDITLDNPLGIYRPGELLSGVVDVKVKEDTRVNGGYISSHIFYQQLTSKHNNILDWRLAF